MNFRITMAISPKNAKFDESWEGTSIDQNHAEKNPKAAPKRNPNHDSKRNEDEVKRLVEEGIRLFVNLKPIPVFLNDSDAKIFYTAWKKKISDGGVIEVTVVKGIHQKGSDAHIKISAYAVDRNNVSANCPIHINLTLITEQGFSYWAAVQVSIKKSIGYPTMALASRLHSSVGRRDSVDYSTAKSSRNAALAALEESAEIERLGRINMA